MSNQLNAIAEKANIPVEQLALSGKIYVLSALLGAIAKTLKQALAQKKVSFVGVRMPAQVDRALGDSKRGKH